MAKRNTFYVRIFREGKRYRVCTVYSSNHRIHMKSYTLYRQWRSALESAEYLARQLNNATIWLPDGRCHA